MRSRYGPCDQRFDSAQTRCNDRQRHSSHQVLSFFGPALQFETQDAPKTIKQLASADVARMAFKAGIIDRFDCRMSFEELRYRQCAFILMSNTKCKSLHATMK